ncbi:hypothetical protein J2Z32_001603 [Paenibacillus turicensis]|uniref:HIRAN domain-containing protein n=1 Tax=Paenibacillus turicensis TaxID=160487 RepID=A0ABS4FRI9_9BACL|nr:HIRAN domain-containing protein [Paenibacillus turicensis]MBP1904978.1 hypothetical protein [Paenibacillus turicensis]
MYPKLHLVDYNSKEPIEGQRYGHQLSNQYWDIYSNENLKERATKLTEADIWVYTHSYDLFQMFPDIISFDGLYDKNIKSSLAIKYYLVFMEKDEFVVDKLLNEKDINFTNKRKEARLVFYEFLYEVDRDYLEKKIMVHIMRDKYFEVAQHTQRDKKEHFYRTRDNILEIIDTQSPLGTMNIPAFNFFISLTPLKVIHDVVNYNLIDPISKLRYSSYIGLNNGKKLYATHWGINREFLESFGHHEFHDPIFYKDLDEILRSTWEANIARLLNEKGIEWKYEKERYEVDLDKEQKANYLPDFVLPNEKVIIEVKGFWDTYSLKAYTAAKAKYTEWTFLHVDSDIYHSLNQVYKDKVSNWDYSKISIKADILPIVGITQKERIPFIKKLLVGDNVIFERDANNPFDKNAIKALNSDGEQLGFLSKEWASIYAEKMDLGIKYQCEVVSIEPKVINIKVNRLNTDEMTIPEVLKL